MRHSEWLCIHSQATHRKEVDEDDGSAANGQSAEHPGDAQQSKERDGRLEALRQLRQALLELA